MKEIVKKDKKAMLMIIGTGPLYQNIEQKICKYEIQNNIILLDSKSDINKYYSAFDCFVLPSKYEGLGIVNIEAQVSGLDVIVSSSVPQEAKITPNLNYLDLSLGANRWAIEILKLK